MFGGILADFQDKDTKDSKSKGGSPHASNIDVKGPFLSIPGTHLHGLQHTHTLQIY